MLEKRFSIPIHSFTHTAIALATVLILPEGCAAPPVPAPVVQTSPLAGRLETGTVLAVRSADSSQDNAVTNAILSALGQIPANGNERPAAEMVIRRADGTAGSMVEHQQDGQPGLIPGEKVVIVEAATTVIHPE